MKKNLIIVTGGAGFVGSNLISYLIKKTKYKIISIDNYSSGNKKNEIKNKKTIEVWGSGKPFRELIFVDDIADACIFFMNKKIKESLINIGSGKDMRIKDYTKFLIKKLKLNVKIKFKKSKPDGVFRKVLDVSKAKKYGWKAKISLDRGFELTYKDYLKKNIT